MTNDRNDPITALVRSARAMIQNGDSAEAIRFLEEVVRQAPHNGESHLLLCLLMLEAAHPRALDLLQLCLKRFPHPSSGWEQIGEALSKHGRKEAALLCFNKSLPSLDMAIRRGLLARELGRRAEALETFIQAADLGPSSERAWFLVGVSAQDLGQYEQAEAAYRRVLALNPHVAEAAVNLGIVLQAKGDLQAAKSAYGLALRQRPETFGRVSQALPGATKGELWLNLAALRHHLAG